MPSLLRVHSFAKINLYLDVLPRRPDGFHNIETIFQTVDLHDTLTLENSPDLALTSSDPALDCGNANLVCRAAAALRERTHCRLGARMHLEKRIPIAAGLAGGSGNAAAALVGLNRLWGLRLRPEELAEIAATLGSDVPYCLAGGLVAATGRGEILETIQSSALDGLVCVLAHPPIGVSTREVYESPLLKKNTNPVSGGKTEQFRAALKQLAAGNIGEVVFNAMEEPVFAMHPELGRIKNTLLENGCIAAAMSGSGATVFGLCTSAGIAQRVRRYLEPIPVSIVGFTSAGVQLRGDT